MSAGADLDYLSVHNMAKTIYLSGKLIKASGHDFTIDEVLLIQSKLKLISPYINSDLENWDLNGWQSKKLGARVKPETYKDLSRKRERKKEDDIILDLS